MPDNRLRNPNLLGSGKPNPARSIGELLPDWGFEHKANDPFIVPASDAGFTIELPHPGSRFRLWQEVSFAMSSAPRTFDAVLTVGNWPPASHGLTVDWIALLRLDGNGKRVFASRPAQLPTIIAGESAIDIGVSFDVPPLAHDEPRFFAVQLSGGPGAALIVGARLIERPATAVRAPAIAPTKAAAGVAQPIITAHDGTITGTVDLAADEGEILCFIDGKLIGTATLAARVAGGTSRAFRIAVAENYCDGAEHAVGVRRVSGQRLGSVVRLILVPRRARATEPAKQAVPTLSPPPARAAKRRVCVIAWDMGHNPVGRAFLLAEMAAGANEVELCGPSFPAYGTGIWPPIASAGMPMESFAATDFLRFIEGARALAERVRCDVVIVGKPRLPSLLIGALIKQANRCPMIVDVDDHELGFFSDRTPATLADLIAAITAEPTLLDTPYGEIFTRYAENLIAACDGVTVSNYALQARFGGIVVRHGRDERLFDPALHNRAATRAAFGYQDEDRVILFLGTPRSHKGVFEIADAIERLADDRIALCVIGTITDKRISRRFASYKSARIALHPDQPWSRLPELVAMADAVFLLQDPASPISDFQIPAKLTDAIALGVPVYATPVPPLADLIAAGAIVPIAGAADLHAALKAFASAEPDPAAGERRRAYYLGELSYAVNGARIDLAIDHASKRSRAIVPAFDALFDGLEQVSGAALPRFGRRWVVPAIWRETKPDLVFLWKQNDSDIYGRRSDMLVKYLLESGAINRILHLDAPISLLDLEKLARHAGDSVAHQGKLVYLNTVRRLLHLSDSERLIRRTFLYRTPKGPENFLGIDLPQKSDYPAFIRETVKAAGLSPAPILWVSPVLFDYPEIKGALDPACVVADIIDDQRSFKSKEDYRKRLVRAYDEVLRDADLVFANCAPVQAGFADLRPDIRLVPNGAEPFKLSRKPEAPAGLAGLDRPILGYVGNLRDRVDFALVRKVANALPQATIVLIGSAHDRPDALELAALPNIRLLGVKPYEEAIAYIRSFNVAIMPHIRNDLSDNMNPLKLYVYFALGVPIVTTDVANIDDIARVASVAPDHDAFIAAVRDVLAGKVRKPTARVRKQIMERVSWKSRVDDILQSIGLER